MTTPESRPAPASTAPDLRPEPVSAAPDSRPARAPRFTRSLCRPPFDTPIAEDLVAEFLERPPARRRQAIRKLWQREGLLRWTGLASRRVDRVPPGVRQVLWVTTWTTVGDAVMDLAARSLVPDGIALDLLIAPALAPLFVRDARFRHVYTDPASIGATHDLVLLDVLSTAAIRLLRRHLAGRPFATLRGHLLGERFDRAAFADRRIRQLFGRPDGEVVAPWLTLADEERAPRDPARTAIAVPLGARVPEKRYPHWPAALARIVDDWPADRPPPSFVLLGHGADARDDLARFDGDWLARHARTAIADAGTLRDAMRALSACDAFLGIDGGLMHVAVALGVPGLALFARVDPRWFLRPGGSMRSWRLDGLPAELPPERLATLFLDEISTPRRRP